MRAVKQYTVSQVAALAHVTVRTLHHYDEIGLLRPEGRSEAGYRLYGDADLARLHEIVLFRELGFSLEAIARLLDEPVSDRRAALRAQREALVVKVDKTKAVIAAVDRALEALEEGTSMEPEKLFEGFEAFAEEAEQRWGETEAYRESMRRTKRYTKEDWARIQAEAGEVEEQLAVLMRAGAAPGGDPAMALAEKLRLHIDRWYYPCSHAMHAALAEGYVTDPRFTAYYDKRAEGLAVFVSAAIKANSAR